MLMKKWDTNLQESMGPAGLCDLIEEECQKDINTSCRKIAAYFLTEPCREMPEPVCELVQILYAKLDDEVQHLFRKESGLIFPEIKKIKAGSCIQQHIPDSIQQTQQVVINLLLKLRQLLNNYVVQPEWSMEWKSCINEFFILETELHQWIYIEQSLLYPAILHKKDPVK